MAPSPPRHRRLSSSLSLASPPADRPPLAALFLIDFDVKAGYTISWKRSLPGLDLDGHVEYKSLPSGLHTVPADLVYFVHDAAHAGLSAFVNEPCSNKASRNARMIAVGVLVPLSHGRLGHAWRHAQDLEDLAAKLAKDRLQTDLLESYWLAHKPSDTPPEPMVDRGPHSRSQSISDGILMRHSDHRLSPHHPIWSLTKLLDRFGPLIFPIYRAALLRKRILISCHAPVRPICDFVYDISVLSNLPLSVSSLLPPAAPAARLRPLFTIGVHDIPFLVRDLEAARRKNDGRQEQDDASGSGWVACTTDSILAVKDTLWDMIITMPPEGGDGWPVVECPCGSPVKATQRDLRRFNSLRDGLACLGASASPDAAPDSSPSPASAPRPSTSSRPRLVGDESLDRLAEPPSWASLAYNGYMWWASAGEQLHSDRQQESSRDAALLAHLGPAPHTAMSVPRLSTGSDPLADSVTSFAAGRPADSDEARVELAVIAYFHRLTRQMLSTLADVDAAEPRPGQYRDEDENDEDDDDADTEVDEAEALLDGGPDAQPGGDAIAVDGRCVDDMGLDVWSAADAAFIRDLAAAYFGRSARVEGKGVEVCGVRVC